MTTAQFQFQTHRHWWPWPDLEANYVSQFFTLQQRICFGRTASSFSRSTAASACDWSCCPLPRRIAPPRNSSASLCGPNVSSAGAAA